MNKKYIKLSEIQFNTFIAESVLTVLNELGIRTNNKQYLNESLLIEAMSLEDINQKYYNSINPDVFLKITTEGDPTWRETAPDKMGIYGKWLLNLYINNSLKLEDLYKVKEYLTFFNKFKNKLNEKDINKYKSLPDLYDAVSPFMDNPEQVSSKSEELRMIKQNEAEKVYEDNQWLVVIPKTEKAACLYSKHTQWCTAATKGPNMFNVYNLGGPLYINIDKVNNRKYQFHFDSGQFMDERNDDIKKPILDTIGASEGLKNFYYKLGYSYKLYYDSIDDFYEGFAVVKLKGKGFNFINQKRKLLCNQWFDDVSKFKDGIAYVKSNKKGWNIINQNGDFLLKEYYDEIGNFHEGFAIVELKKGCNFINKKGEILCDQWFDSVGNFREGFAAVQLDGKGYNFIDQNGKYLTPNRWYDEISSFKKGIAQIKLGDDYYEIDKEGNILSN